MVGGDQVMMKEMLDKFSVTELAVLRNELMQNGLDAFQAAELFKLFLAGRGYGASQEAVIDAASKIGHSGCDINVMQKELSNLALVM
jgi:hypothetical protein